MTAARGARSLDGVIRPFAAASAATLFALVVLLVPATAAPLAPSAPSARNSPAPDPATVVVVDGRAEPPQPELRQRPKVRGDHRFGQKVRATRGRWRHGSDVDEVRFRWMRDGEPIRGRRAGARSYRIAPQDVGHRIKVRVRVRIAGQPWVEASSRFRKARHRQPVRRTVTWSLATRGRITADVRGFARKAQQTFDDPRGWRGHGVEFRRVARGGSFTLVLAEASTVPTFSSGCSAQWSCRVGRFVVINQTRWQHASPAWNAAKRSLRDYRHMVVNHETGHWLGRGHARCGGRGQLAPVMMQQSKGRAGCRFNPWPLRGE